MGATALLLPAAQATLTALLPQLTEQIKLSWGFKRGGLQKLQRRLKHIQGLLRDADRGQINSEALKEWLKSLKSVTCDVENVLGELAYEALRRKLEVGKRKRYKVRNFFSPSNPLAFHIKMANEVNDMNKLLDEICKEAQDLGLTPSQFMSASVSPSEHRPSTTPFLDKSPCVGRDRDVEIVKDMLLHSEGDLSVIAIVGIAGLGKTTLAQLVYHDKKIVEFFGDNRIWICVSDDFTEERLFNEMVEYLFKVESKISNIGAIVKKLGEKLKENKYLLVLDDVWNEIPEKWEKLTSSLMGIGGSKESKIIVTTRSEKVISIMRVPKSLTHPLCKLSSDNSWTMFRERVFVGEGPKETETLSKIGGRMVEMCKGVPLAIKSIGGLLYDKKSPEEWESIEKSEIWRSEGEILPALRLSFYHLPSPFLKQCFAYCSIFVKDEVLIKDDLIHLWMSLGYLQPLSEGNSDMEDVGHDYFNILLRNSLFQDVGLDEYNNVISCKMHDLVHDLAMDVSKGSCLTSKASMIAGHTSYGCLDMDVSKGFCLTSKASMFADHPEVQHLSLCPEVQHLSLCRRETRRLEVPEENIGKLRTLFLTGNLPENTKDVKSIRALRIVTNYFDVIKLSSSICQFIHLKYLDLSCIHFMELKLPNFITKLYNLETLMLPRMFPDILEDIQTEFHKLVNLRHLCVKDAQNSFGKTPSMIGRLTSLRTLPLFSVGEDKGHKIEELGCLSKLRGRLRVDNLQHVKDKEEAKGAKLSEKSKLTELEFNWYINPGMMEINYGDVLEGLKPHENLRGLILRNFGGQRLASWMSRSDKLLHNLVKIELINCKLCQNIPILGHLPLLEVVLMKQLDNVESIGPEFYGSNEPTAVFPVLRKLTISDMPKLKVWSDVSPLPHATMSSLEFFPQLEELYIEDCPNLINIPGHLLSRVRDLSVGFGGVLLCKPFFSIVVDRRARNIGTLIEYLLEKSKNFLRHLQISCFEELCYLPKQLLNLASLETLCIKYCPKLTYIGEQIGAKHDSDLRSLRKVLIFSCRKLRWLPKGLLQPALVSLEISYCSDLAVRSPEELSNLTSLQTLQLIGCCNSYGWARCWEEGQFCLTGLRKLVIGEFSEELDYFPWPEVEMVKARNPQHYPFMFLESLEMRGWPKLKCLPDQLRHLTSLKHLEIKEFEGLEALPEWLGNFSSLESLALWRCRNLTSLSSLKIFQLLKNLQVLDIIDCPLLWESCKEGGEERNKIAHIPKIYIPKIYPSIFQDPWP